MKSWMKNVLIGVIGTLWILLLVFMFIYTKSAAGEALLVTLFVVLSALVAYFGYELYKDLYKNNKILNAFANREKRTFLFELNYKSSIVKIYNNNLNLDKTMKLKNFAKKYLGIVENSKEYIALIIGKLDLDYYNKQYIKVTDNNEEKYYKFKCLLTEKDKLFGSIEQMDQ